LTFFLANLFNVLGAKLWIGFSPWCLLFVFVAAVVALIAVLYIYYSGEIRNIRGKILILVQILIGFYVGWNSLDGCIQNVHGYVGSTSTSQTSMQIIGNAMLSYEIKTGHLPSSNDWCDVILSREEKVYRETFAPAAKQDAPCSFAFNYNLGGLPIDGLDPNTVLIFEADGPWNFAAGPEKFPGTRYRDRYFPNKEKCVFIFFVDGTLVKYRLYDGAIAKYDKNLDSLRGFVFTKNFVPQGKTPYSPLRWK
jgi:hypothetical protein